MIVSYDHLGDQALTGDTIPELNTSALFKQFYPGKGLQGLAEAEFCPQSLAALSITSAAP